MANVVGTFENDSLVGGIGNDVLNGLQGNDTMSGEVGNDVYYVDSAGDLIGENVGAGVDVVYSIRSPAEST